MRPLREQICHLRNTGFFPQHGDANDFVGILNNCVVRKINRSIVPRSFKQHVIHFEIVENKALKGSTPGTTATFTPLTEIGTG